MTRRKSEVPRNKDILTDESRSKRAKQAITSRTKGHNLERFVVNMFRKIGFTSAHTSRYASTLLDDNKVDVANIPLNIQCKNVKANINYADLLDEINGSLEKNIPDRLEYPTVIIHKKDRGRTMAIMEDQTFYKLILLLKNNNLL